jgi:ketosteroid isomerase-like protein
MSDENIEIVRRALETNRSGRREETVDAAIALADPSIEFSSRLNSIEGSTYRGHDGLRAYYHDMTDAFEQWRNDLDAAARVDSDAVLTDVTFRATARSGVDVELRSSVIFVLSSGRIVQIHAARSREEVLRAAGLSE